MERAPIRPRERLTADEYWERQAELERSELIDGEVVAMPPTGLPHGRIEARISRMLDEWAEPRGALVAGGEVGYELGPDTVRGADVCVHLAPPSPERGWTKTPPDLVVEVVSPNDRWSELEQKAALWLGFGVREVWIADPATRRVMVRRPDGTALSFAAGDTLTSGVLEGFEAPVERLLPQ